MRFEAGDDFLRDGIRGQVLSLKGIGGMIVEFLGSVRFTAVPRVTIAPVGERVVTKIIGGERRLIPNHRRILEQRGETAPFIFRIGRQAA